ncbi:hypothetical protein KKF59_01950 [Patescibacteria group bacterium]|nr:hypothetical protein [Patescibacteria group bacterium]MBU1629861.1 hypothetical protein [Patescibacteria group bacterium]MBU1907874.1 hypothetical protein [Patescibacteria group bacterium]
MPMYKPRHGSKSGGKKFGGGKFQKKDFRRSDSARPDLFDATCAECGKECQVPFRPNGRKPVLCTFCFKKDDYSEPKRFAGSDFKKPSFREDRQFAPRGNSIDLKDQLKTINSKLDAIMEALDV